MAFFLSNALARFVHWMTLYRQKASLINVTCLFYVYGIRRYIVGKTVNCATTLLVAIASLQACWRSKK